MPPGMRHGNRAWGPSLTCRILTLLLMSGIGCSGCYQPAVIPPTASIERPMPPLPPSNPLTQIPETPPSIPLTVPPRESVPEMVQTWKPDVAPRDWKYIVLHHTATDRGNVDSIHEAHLKNKDKNGNPWQGIGYHFVVGNGDGMSDGEIEPTFRWRGQMHGAHAGVGEYNQSGIGIVLIGNFEKHPPTSIQTNAVKTLVHSLAAEYGITSDRVMGHGDVKATECPGRLFPLTEVRNSTTAAIFQDHLRANVPVPLMRN